jgi:hypothetical protein
MNRPYRFTAVLAMLLCASILAAATGCGLFQQEQPKRPNTVEGWMQQPRVQP